MIRLPLYGRLGATAFRSVLGRKQSKYREVTAWLEVAIRESMPGNGKELSKLRRIARQGDAVFSDYKY